MVFLRSHLNWGEYKILEQGGQGEKDEAICTAQIGEPGLLRFIPMILDLEFVGLILYYSMIIKT